MKITRRDNRGWRSGKIKLTAATVVVAIAGVAFASPTVAGDDTGSVQDSFERALVAHQQLAATRPGHKVQEAHVTLSQPGAAADLMKLDAAHIREAKVNGAQRLAQAFTGPELAELLKVHAAATRDVSPTDYTVDGGARDFRYASIDVEGDRATVHATVNTWASYVHQGNGRMDVSTPSSDILVDATMVKVGKNWKMSNFDWAFVPGQEP